MRVARSLDTAVGHRWLRVACWLLTGALAAFDQSALAENWPCWRGPRGDGTSTETNLPTTWNGESGENVAWKTPIPGVGHASPVVWGDRILLVTCLEESEQRVLLCLDRRTGQTLWQRVVLESPLEGKHVLNSFASSTPVTDGQRIFVSFLDHTRRAEAQQQAAIGGSDPDQAGADDMVVAAFDMNGSPLWLVRPGAFSSKHGYCSSPVLFENLVIVNGDHDGDAYLVALEQSTGEIVWKVPRENRTRSYCTPIVRYFNGEPHMILSGSLSVCSYDPRTGERQWIIDGPTEQFVASIVDNGKLLFMTAGFPDRHLLAIKPDGAGNVTETAVVWRTTENCSYVPSPVVVGDYLLMVSDQGVASCFLAATGERTFRERIGPRYSASLVAADGLAYFLSDRGDTMVIRPGREFDVVAENPLGEACSASPAICGGQIFLRGERHLYCIGVPSSAAR